MIGPPLADAIAFLKPAGITATKRPSLPVTPVDADVVLDLAIGRVFVEPGAVVFDEIEAVVVAEAATRLDEDEKDPQPAKASAAATA